jgi:hypothetical protein
MNKFGQPVKYKTPKELQTVVEEYFSEMDNRIKTIFDPKTNKEVVVNYPAPYTMSGLARRVGLSRQGLLNYKNKPEFTEIIEQARERVHEDVETRLMEGRAQTGAIFNLKNNFGWKDESHTDFTTGGKPLVGFDLHGKGTDQSTDKPTA